MAIYPYQVQIVWDIIYQFIKDWQNEPYRWSREIDIQTEISSRIFSVYKAIGKDVILANYKECISGFESDQKWNKICCEPKIVYTFKDNKKYNCHPDIVIWDNLEDPNSPSDEVKDKNLPILWACEIKLDQNTKNDWDKEKMQYLIDQGIIKFGCWLVFTRKRADKGNGIIWDNMLKDNSLWSCNIKMPAA